MVSMHCARRLNAKRRKAVSLLVFLTLVFALVLPGQAQAAPGSDGTRTLPVGKYVLGALSAAWWQYALEAPAASNPLLDDSGANCAARQSGPVFFLVGTNGSGVATRNECRVPRGRILFFPLANAFDVHVPDDGLDTPELAWKDLQVKLGFAVTSLKASIDGVPVRGLDPNSPRYRGCVGPDRACGPRSFSLNLPAGNLYDLDAGRYAPAVADGYYLLLPPLKSGKHTIVFGGSGNLDGAFTQSTTYHLTVL